MVFYKVMITQVTPDGIAGRMTLVKDYKTMNEARRDAVNYSSVYAKQVYQIREYDASISNLISFDENDTGKVTETVGYITSRRELYCHIVDDYQKYDTELSGAFFDVEVCMPKREILEAYAELQADINDDVCVRIINGIQQDALVLDGEFEEEYCGNCEKFLRKFNDNPEFKRYNDDVEVDFVF